MSVAFVYARSRTSLRDAEEQVLGVAASLAAPAGPTLRSAS